jgi:phosphoesterase RecJ-like protein
VDVAAFFSEISENYYRVSLRSKGSINVERVARKFGGGGHVNAAACKIEGPLEDVKSRMVQSIMNG